MCTFCSIFLSEKKSLVNNVFVNTAAREMKQVLGNHTEKRSNRLAQCAIF